MTASIAALYLSFRLNRRENSRTRLLKGETALIMEAAITGMHYTGMAAAAGGDASLAPRQSGHYSQISARIPADRDIDASKAYGYGTSMVPFSG